MGADLPYPSLEDLRGRVVTAVSNLYRYDGDLIIRCANERSITHKLAEHMQREFLHWHVDCEYNRAGCDPKRLNIAAKKTSIDATEAVTVYPDIVVHRRGTDVNLLVVEVKKGGGEIQTWDEEKLRAFTSHNRVRYQFGLFLKLCKKGCTAADLYKNGETCWTWDSEIQTRLEELGYGG